MQVYSKPETRLIAGISVNVWQHGVIYAYAKSLMKTALEAVKTELEKDGFEDVNIEPIMSGTRTVGWALSATKYPQE